MLKYLICPLCLHSSGKSEPKNLAHSDNSGNILSLSLFGITVKLWWNLLPLLWALFILYTLSLGLEFSVSFAHNSTTNDAIDKQRPQFNSAHQIGSETPWIASLVVVAKGITAGKESLGGIFHPQKLMMFLAAKPQPVELWKNRYYNWIQRV